MGCLATRYNPSPTVPTQMLSCESCIRQEIWPSESDGLAPRRRHWPSAFEKWRRRVLVRSHIRLERSSSSVVTIERVEPCSKGVGSYDPVQLPSLSLRTCPP